MMIIKKIFLLVFAGVLFGQQVFSQIAVHPGANGIFISCGNILPKDFSYRISRKEASGNNWQQIADLHFPKNEIAWQGRIMQQAMSTPEARIPDSSSIANLWQKLKISLISDSLYMWTAQPFMLAACGTGWWDRTAQEGKQYQYKVEEVRGNNAASANTTTPVSYPGPAPDFLLQPDTIQSNSISVRVHYRLLRYKGMAGVKVYRAYFLRDSSFVQIHPLVLYNDKNGQKYMNVSDQSVVNSAQYSYFVVPYDIYGNEGHPSDTVNVYNKRLNTIQPIVTDFNGKSREKENMIHLSWKIAHPADVVSVDVYKALSYDGYYTRIGSVSPQDTVFTDHNVKPVTTYFYTLVLRAAYGRTFPSTRAAVIFKANKKNLFPPANLEAVRDGNVVRLKWDRTFPDTRGYYLYRAVSFTSAMQPVGKIILSKDSDVTYTDSLADIPNSPVWIYAVASENTSYAISPLSDRVSVSGGTVHMPIPSGLRAMLEDGSVQLFWNNLTVQHPEVTGYHIERHEENNDRKPIASSQQYFEIKTPGINSYMDTTVQPGHHYIYTVQSLGLNASDVSSSSLQTGAYLPAEILPAPNNVVVMNTGKGALLQWNLPMGSHWDQINIYRAQPGQEPALLKTLPADADTFTDTDIKQGQNYFYWIATVSKNGTEGRMKMPVGIRTGS